MLSKVKLSSVRRTQIQEQRIIEGTLFTRLVDDEEDPDLFPRAGVLINRPFDPDSDPKARKLVDEEIRLQAQDSFCDLVLGETVTRQGKLFWDQGYHFPEWVVDGLAQGPGDAD
jgi:hypothetical protein